MFVPTEPKVYHILHWDRLPSVIKDGFLWCDAAMVGRLHTGTAIGMEIIKQRRRSILTLGSHPELLVGDCVPFYFCSRSVMLYVIYKKNHPELAYRGGQGPIVHLEADLRQAVAWADANSRRWAFTSSNAASSYFSDYHELAQLSKLDWDAIRSNSWMGERSYSKQAEFLLELSFPWELVSRIGVHSAKIRDRVLQVLQVDGHRPTVEIKPGWYY